MTDVVPIETSTHPIHETCRMCLPTCRNTFVVYVGVGCTQRPCLYDGTVACVLMRDRTFGFTAARSIGWWRALYRSSPSTYRALYVSVLCIHSRWWCVRHCGRLRTTMRCGMGLRGARPYVTHGFHVWWSCMMVWGPW